MKTRRHSRSTGNAAWSLVGLVLLCAPAWAEEHQRALAGPLLPLYQQECGACHLAYPPALLPAASWQRVMGSLPHHYGTDASLPPDAALALSQWLASQAGANRRTAEEPAGDRITRSRWFVREHREVAPSTWQLPAVKSAAQCDACHRQAQQGDFNEPNIRIPR